MEQLDRGLGAGLSARLVDLAHPAATDQQAELERPDRLVGEPARATDLERAIELGTRFGEQSFALRDTMHRLFELEGKADLNEAEQTELKQLMAEYRTEKPYEEMFFQLLEHHQREGFLHLKLMEPRSYDYNRIKAWDDRLRMPQFQFARVRRLKGETDAAFKARTDKEEAEAREAVMTFVLGLVAEPVPPRFINAPRAERLAEVKGRQVLDKFNCASCHQLRPGVYEFKAVPPSDLPGTLELLDLACTNAKNDKADYQFKDHSAWVGPTQQGPDRFVDPVQRTQRQTEVEQSFQVLRVQLRSQAEVFDRLFCLARL